MPVSGMSFSDRVDDEPMLKAYGSKRRAADADLDRGREPGAKPPPTKKSKPTKVNRFRKPAANPIASNRAISRCFEDCSKEDKLLITMRDSGKSWPEVKAAWEEMTNAVVALSTLPNRYTRLKNNFVSISLDDQTRLLEAKRQVENEFDLEKWDRIAKVVNDCGGRQYTGISLRREYTKLMDQKSDCVPPDGVDDPDFDRSALDGDTGEDDTEDNDGHDDDDAEHDTDEDDSEDDPENDPEDY